MLSKVPADRFETAGEFIRALESTGGDSAKGSAWKSGAAVGVLGLIVAGAMMVGSLRPRPPEEPRPVGLVILPFDGAGSGPGDVASLHLAFQDALVASHRASHRRHRAGDRTGRVAVRLLSPSPAGCPPARGAYVVVGMVRGGPAAQHVSVELYTTDGERLLRSDEPITGNRVDESIGDDWRLLP